MANSERRRQSDRTAEARRKLVAATIALISEKGIAGFSLADVGERAGVSRGLPGHHFRTRDRLVAVATAGLLRVPIVPVEGGLDGLITTFRASLGRSRDPRVRALLTILSAPPGVLGAPDAVQAYIAGCVQMVQAHLGAGMDAGVIRSDPQPQQTAAVLVSAVFGVALTASEDPAMLGQQIDTFVSLVRRSVAVPEFETKEPARRPHKSKPVPEGLGQEMTLFPLPTETPRC